MPRPAMKLTAPDLARHKRMIARLKRAQELAQQAAQLQEEANRIVAGFQMWAEDLHESYALDAGRGEGVNEDGSIVRKSA